MKLHETEQWEIDQEIPLPKTQEKPCKFLQSKAVLVDDNPEEGKIQIEVTNGGGLYFKFTSREEHTVEEIEECDLGHKHRRIVLKDFNYESITISRADAKNLLEWLRMRVK